MKTFTIECAENYTANDLLKRIAEQNGFERVFIEYGKQLLRINGKLFEFSHVKSIYENPVTVYLDEYTPPRPYPGTPGWYKQKSIKKSR